MIFLRPYQQKFVEDIKLSLATHKEIIACAATGSGKTKVFISISRAAIEKGRTVLIISESTKIYTQIHKEIGTTVNIGDGVKEFYVSPNKIYVAMAQTLIRRPGLIKQFADMNHQLLIIIDEAHIGTPTKILNQIPNAYKIGFTATPNYKDAKHLPTIYKDIVIGPQAQELIEMGFLSPYRHFERQIAQLSLLQKGSNGEFTEKSQEAVFEKREVFDGILQDLLGQNFNKCMVYCASISHCEDVATKLKQAGYLVSCVHSKNPNTGFELHQFTNGDNKICVSVASLTKGFDFPAIDLIILNRATTSLSLYNQMCGRGGRISPNKTKFTVIDYGQNGTRHNLWNFSHNWAELWKSVPKSKKQQAPPLKMCPKCGFMMAVSCQSCENCGFAFLKNNEPVNQQETVLIELTKDFNVLRGRKLSTLTPHELYTYSKITGNKNLAKRVARAKGDEFLRQFAVLNKYKFGWWNYIKADKNLGFNDLTVL